MIYLVKGLRNMKKRVSLSKLLKLAEHDPLAEKTVLVYTGKGEKAESVTVEEYKKAPCALLPLPYCKCSGSTLGRRHLAGEGIEAAELPEGAYYRLYRKLGDMQRIKSERYSVRQLFLREDEDDKALAFGMAKTAEQFWAIEHFALDPASDDKLSAAVHSRETGDCICCGLARVDAEVGEGWIEALLVPEADDEAVMLLINELLRRLAAMAPFATACAPANDPALVRLLRKSGFAGGDVWAG